MMYPYPGYCGTGLRKLTEVPGTGIKVLQNLQNFRVLWHARTELPAVSGRYKHAVPVPLVFLAPAYRTPRSSGYGYDECPTEGTEVLCRLIPGGKYPGYGFMCALHTERKYLIESSGAGMNVPNS